MKKLSHYDKSGKVKMVDVGDKKNTKRTAIASARVFLNKETLKAIESQRPQSPGA